MKSLKFEYYLHKENKEDTVSERYEQRTFLGLIQK